MGRKHQAFKNSLVPVSADARVSGKAPQDKFGLDTEMTAQYVRLKMEALPVIQVFTPSCPLRNARRGLSTHSSLLLPFRFTLHIHISQTVDFNLRNVTLLVGSLEGQALIQLHLDSASHRVDECGGYSSSQILDACGGRSQMCITPLLTQEGEEYCVELRMTRRFALVCDCV